MIPPRVSRTIWLLSGTLALAGCISNPPSFDVPDRSDAPGDRGTAAVAAPAGAETWMFRAPVPGLAKTVSEKPKAGKTSGEGTLASSEDLWNRLRQSFALSIPEKPSIERQREWYASHPEYLKRVQERAEPYLYFIVEELERRNLPGEIALLPVVESAFQPFAYSRGHASGIWQFIPSTGRLYGLKQNWWYDGRRDVVASTRAAFDFLQHMHERFDGDWELALASYNAGGGTVSRAIRKNQKRGKPTDFWSLDLPRETSNYVPRLLAIAQLIATPERYGVSLESLPNEPYFASVDIGSQLDLALAAEMAGLGIDELYRLNPGYNRWATDPEGPHELQIPVAHIERFETELTQLDPDKRLCWKRYRIRNGDSLSGIARRNGTSVAVLQQVNQLNGTRIRAGKHLLIPVSTKRLDRYALSSDQRRKKSQATPRKGSRSRYVVRSGDTLWDISREHQVSHKKLASWNGIAPRDILRPGQELVIWQQAASGRSDSALTDKRAVKPVDTRSSVTYRVRKGDSLALIARKFNVSVADLKRWNTLPGKYLQPGQRLVLYVDVTEQRAL